MRKPEALLVHLKIYFIPFAMDLFVVVGDSSPLSACLACSQFEELFDLHPTEIISYFFFGRQRNAMGCVMGKCNKCGMWFNLLIELVLYICINLWLKLQTIPLKSNISPDPLKFKFFRLIEDDALSRWRFELFACWVASLVLSSFPPSFLVPPILPFASAATIFQPNMTNYACHYVTSYQLSISDFVFPLPAAPSGTSRDCFNYETKSCQGDFIKQINSFPTCRFKCFSSWLLREGRWKKKHKSECRSDLLLLFFRWVFEWHHVKCAIQIFQKLFFGWLSWICVEKSPKKKS